MKKTAFTGAAAFILCTAAGSAADLEFAPGTGAFSWDGYTDFAATHDYSGQVITVYTPWTAEDQVLVESLFAYFEAATGARINHSGSDSFEQQIVIDVEAGSPPHVAVFPQPGLAADMAARGHLVPLGEDFAAWTRANYAAGSSWVDLGSYADAQGDQAYFGFFYRVDLKSLVWYVPENFEDAGYEVPATMEALKALSERIVADGGTPWCIGLGSGAATGWPATDWVEDMLLRTQPIEVYDAWVTNRIRFDDPRVVAAIEAFGDFARTDGYAAGGAGAVATTDFRESPLGLFASPPQCYLHRQASFIPSFFPDGTQIGVDTDFFYFPAFADKDLGSPILGSGALWAITRESDAARGLLAFLKTPFAHEVWMAQTGFLTPHKGVNMGVQTDPTVAKMNAILLGADTFRFDGSDLMPGAIGAGAFWSGMVDYAGGKDAALVAASIQETWDALK